ncbi:MAG: hypothetical protein B9S34_13570 [Opitutia bacterium Tous-C1TDCM]|nr:MAG: hypothetical protein B9S34_13570 [Opitutae bacterium Tous-C1TDCM]
MPAVPAILPPAAASPSTAAAPDADVVKLSVFAVDAAHDDEYRAANPATGTRCNTPLKDLPIHIGGLTTDFMRDSGALDLREALGYVSGIQLDTTTGGTGGGVNVSSVLAGNRPVSRAGTTFGSFGFRRAEFLWSGPILPDGLVGFKLTDNDRPVNFGAAIRNLLVSPAGGVNGSGFGAFVNTTTESSGFDAKVDYVPLRHLRFNVGVSKNDVQIRKIEPFAAPANPDPVRLAAPQRFIAAGGGSGRYLGKPSTDIPKYPGTAFVRCEFQQGFLKNTWARLGAKYPGKREAELISVSTATGDITVDRRLVPAHDLYDLNLGYRRKIGRYHTSFQPNVADLEDDDDFYGADWQTGRTYRLSATVSFWAAGAAWAGPGPRNPRGNAERCAAVWPRTASAGFPI